MRKHTKKRNFRNAILFHWPMGKDFIEDIRLSTEIEEWCEENLTIGKVVVGNMIISIESDIDATAFNIRWL